MMDDCTTCHHSPSLHVNGECGAWWSDGNQLAFCRCPNAGWAQLAETANASPFPAITS